MTRRAALGPEVRAVLALARAAGLAAGATVHAFAAAVAAAHPYRKAAEAAKLDLLFFARCAMVPLKALAQARLERAYGPAGRVDKDVREGAVRRDCRATKKHPDLVRNARASKGCHAHADSQHLRLCGIPV